jgi:solute carrier family 35 protein C2
MSVAGIVKEILTILIAVIMVPGNDLTLLNILGLAVSIAGIVYYNRIKLRYYNDIGLVGRHRLLISCV